MGLDMYLEGERYLWSFNDEDGALAQNIAAQFPEIAGAQVKTVIVELFYWRKSNAIHNWFVRNVQDGVDDCGRYCVTLDKLRELRDVCQAVLDDRARAAELLPTRQGFFFGGIEYDDYYFSVLEKTRLWLTGFLLRDDLAEAYKNWDFHYHSSW